jgi:hypothetical protein
MASEGTSGQIPSASLLQGSQAVSSIGIQAGGKSLPPGGNGAPAATASAGATGAQAQAAHPGSSGDQTPAPSSADPQALVNLLNRHLNDSGRPDQFRMDPSGAALIQQVNPANGQVIGQFSVDEFPALARSIGGSGLLVDSLA